MSLLEWLHEPTHTGEQRCWPCTVVNLLLVAITAMLAGRRRRLLGLGLGVAGTLIISLRGYVVPYTPRFAPQIVAASPVPDHWFGHEPADDISSPRPPTSPDGLSGDIDGERLLARLVEADVLVTDGEGVEPAADFHEAWQAEMDALSALSTDSLADAVFDIAHAADVSVVDGSRREWIVLEDGSTGIDGDAWLSRPVAIAEAAAVRALEAYLDDPSVRRAAAGPLRVFLSTCPDCGVELVESTTMDCCGGAVDPRSVPDDVLACPDCDARLHTFEA